jgi:hypothetical protein
VLIQTMDTNNGLRARHAPAMRLQNHPCDGR